jgi:predicted Zn finger-like uncharacterized protein
VKFFCEQCKAKYQIADERVAGKTVRMKCRKCGHLVEVRAAVTESSGASSPPPAASLIAETGSKPPGAGPPKGPPRAPPPRPSALATSLTAAKPPSARPPDRPATSALAGAFKTNVSREEASAPFDMAEVAPGDDWYVAVNGVPVGPIRIAEVRRKAALGAINDDSLAWQEGLDEWRPVKTFPELAAQVREAALGGRASLTPAPGEVRQSIPPPSRLPNVRGGMPSISPQRMSIRPNFPPTSPSPLARNNVVPISSRLATAERLDDAPTEIGALHGLDPKLSMAPDPFAAPAAAMAAAAAAAGALASPIAPPSASAIAAPGAAQPIVASASVLPPQPRPIPWMPIIVTVLAGSFGITTALVLFTRPAAQEAAPATVTSVIMVPAPPPTASAAPTAAATAEPTPTASAETKVASAAHPASTAGGGGGGQLAPLAPLSTAKSLNLGGLGHGPSADDMESSGVPGQCISGSQVQQVIANHQVAIRRSCWERSVSSKPSANVSVAMTVAADGSAQGVTATGDDPAVANCIQNDVKNWRFPAMGCSQKTSFGFKFVRQ